MFIIEELKGSTPIKLTEVSCTRNYKRKKANYKKLKQEIQNREFSVESLKKSFVNQVEQKLLAENASDYYVGGLRNWSRLREHVHLIESYCKINFNGKIPPKQNLCKF